jgi:import inner membrane translocase subunit TIM16
MEAYRQASQASVRASATAAARQKAGGVSLDEAYKILDLEPSALSKEAIKKKYDYLFDVNSKEKSGSFYIQSKVYRAMERLNYELEPKVGNGGPAAGKGTGGAQGAGAGTTK